MFMTVRRDVMGDGWCRRAGVVMCSRYRREQRRTLLRNRRAQRQECGDPASELRGPPHVGYFSARTSAAVHGVVRDANRARAARTCAAVTGAARLPH